MIDNNSYSGLYSEVICFLAVVFLFRLF